MGKMHQRFPYYSLNFRKGNKKKKKQVKKGRENSIVQNHKLRIRIDNC